MYININDIKGEKTIYLSYPIRSTKEVAVISMLSDNVKYEIINLVQSSILFHQPMKT